MLICKSQIRYTEPVIPASRAVVPHGAWEGKDNFISEKYFFPLSAVSPFDVK